ncbi:MAG: COX15/CtaA family protein [Hyphomonadaceae bacterium]
MRPAATRRRLSRLLGGFYVGRVTGEQAAGGRDSAPRDIGVGVWLVVVCVFVLAMILVGGATRLTDSGLSITEWDLGKGLTPPLSDARWSEEFALYQRTAEYQLQNSHMTQDDFRQIYWWEWSHRFLGKVTGIVFALPFLFFLFTRRLKQRLLPVLGLFAMGGLQGAIGWWMVTSGLWSGVDVSPVRLAVHLAIAFAILAFALSLALDAFAWPRAGGVLGAPKLTLYAFIALLFVQIMLGALLAGSDGGARYADWPTIGGEWLPRTAFDGASLDDLVHNHATQHLLHRSNGYLVALLALLIAATAWRHGQGLAKRAAMALGGLTLAQAALGVATVLMVSPLHASLTHQFGAALLWMAAFIALRCVTVANYRNTN